MSDPYDSVPPRITLPVFTCTRTKGCRHGVPAGVPIYLGEGGGERTVTTYMVALCGWTLQSQLIVKFLETKCVQSLGTELRNRRSTRPLFVALVINRGRWQFDRSDVQFLHMRQGLAAHIVLYTPYRWYLGHLLRGVYFGCRRINKYNSKQKDEFDSQQRHLFFYVVVFASKARKRHTILQPAKFGENW